MKRITLERERRLWSRAELARRVGMDAAAVSRIERGLAVPYRSQREKLAKKLGLRPEELLDEVEPSTPSANDAT